MLHTAAEYGQLLITKHLAEWGAGLERQSNPGLDLNARDHVRSQFLVTWSGWVGGLGCC